MNSLIVVTTTLVCKDNTPYTIRFDFETDSMQDQIDKAATVCMKLIIGADCIFSYAETGSNGSKDTHETWAGYYLSGLDSLKEFFAADVWQEVGELTLQKIKAKYQNTPYYNMYVKKHSDHFYGTYKIF